MGETVYDFCPKCGAVSVDGVCSSCGKREPVKSRSHSEENLSSHVHTSTDDIWQKQETTKNPTPKYLLLGFVGIAIVLLLVVCFGIISFIPNSSKSEGTSSYADFLENIMKDDKRVIVDESEESLFSEVTGEGYYAWLQDCVDKTVDYDLVKKEYVYTNSNKNIDMVFRYWQVENDKQGRALEYINEDLTKAIGMYEEYAELFEEMDESELHQYTVRCESFVTYHDDNILSILTYSNEKIDGEDTTNMFFVYNYDLDNGDMVMSNKLLVYDEAFVEHWMELYEEEYGASTNKHKKLSPGELLETFNNYNCIAFYTPEGMEVGYEYMDEDTGEWKLVTVTLKDYHQYLNVE